LIKLDDIKGRSALDLLESYDGFNPYILGLKTEFLKTKKLLLTDTQSRYIIDNIDRDPQYMNRVVNITTYLGEEIKTKSNLDFTPERILIEFMLAETEKAYHIYGKLTKKSESKLFWLPKTQVTDDPYFEKIDVDVDFTKYNERLSLNNKKLYQHQEEGIKFLLSRNGCILADDMGLGKSMQSIIAAIESGAKKILIVCPSSTKINWDREINVFCDETTIIDGKKFSDAKFTIINFDILKNFHTLVKKGKESEHPTIHRQLANAGFDLCIIDEAHYLKNNDSIRGKIMVELVVKHNIEKVWLLTGTPVANRPMDFFNLLKIIKSPIAQNWQHYATRYCEGRKFFRTLKNGQKKQIWLTDGASNLEELSSKTKNIVLRRLKTEVLDMPDKVITPMYHLLDSKQKKQYEYLWEEYILAKKAIGKKVKEDQKDLVELILLRQFIAQQAIPYTIEMVENAIEMGRKVIVFTSFTEELNVIADHFGKVAVKHNGPMTNSMKQKSVDAFQTNDKIKVFVGNIKSAGVGITLTEGTVVIFNSFDWVTGNNEQAEDRCVFGNQLVMTNNGYKMIEDIKIGDLVYTHNGNFKKVINTHTHLERKKTRVDIDAFGYNNKLSLTNDHKVYIYDDKDNEFKWVECGSLDINTHRMTLKSNNQPIKRKEYLDVINYVDAYFINNYKVKQKNGRLKELPERVTLTNDLLYAFGFFIAEGWAIEENVGKSASVNICQKINNKKMNDASVYIINIIKESFNIESHNEYVDMDNVKTCTIYSKNLAINFNNWFGKGVKNKQLPNWVDELNDEQLENLLEGFYHGDGYKRKNTQEAVSVSPKLGSQLIRYNSNLGRGVSLKIVDGKYYDIEYTIDINNKLNRIYKIGDYITYPIKSLHISKPKRGEERVYDLSVEDDHSFIVGNYNVHNCFRIGQKNDVNVYYQLFDDTISTRMWDILKNKKEVINIILGEKELTEEEITELLIEKLYE
jgi:SWI/SNF-related matrix-associated actin-dependent regulator 1 of chromatin subfamily A